MERDAGVELDALYVDGAASRNAFIMQFQSDLLGMPVIQSESVETTAIGAAYLAGVSVGYWENRDEILQNRATAGRFDPHMDEREHERNLAGWRDAVLRSRGRS